VRVELLESKHLAILLVCACGKTAAPPAAEPPATKPAAATDWTAQPLDATITGTTSGVAFEVRVPKGWILDAELAKVAPELKNYRPDVADHYSAPALTIGANNPNMPASTSLDAFIQRVTDPDETVVSKRELPDGYLVVLEENDHSAVKVKLDRHKGNAWVGCQAMQRPKGAIAAGTATWLSKICESLVVK
jgi:hypothetical protein